MQVTLNNLYSVRPRSSDPSHIVIYYIKWVTSSWTYSMLADIYIYNDNIWYSSKKQCVLCSNPNTNNLNAIDITVAAATATTHIMNTRDICFQTGITAGNDVGLCTQNRFFRSVSLSAASIPPRPPSPPRHSTYNPSLTSLYPPSPDLPSPYHSVLFVNSFILS